MGCGIRIGVGVRTIKFPIVGVRFRVRVGTLKFSRVGVGIKVRNFLLQLHTLIVTCERNKLLPSMVQCSTIDSFKKNTDYVQVLVAFYLCLSTDHLSLM